MTPWWRKRKTRQKGDGVGKLLFYELREAELQGATAVRFGVSDGDHFTVFYTIDGTEREFQNPPMYVWSDLVKEAVLQAGGVLGQRPPFEGQMRLEGLSSEWTAAYSGLDTDLRFTRCATED
ncbi:MAG: hypothetical protein HN742_37070 [Lentisphaerae bacterium]|jgi:hypothetical protein|nr:hypothetical protein [Lentisphaerota bacterium]MBT5609015.1 hypothetical protein [Lentisphaerota bacterium]MBT7057453.1 hypothetical protein [Lentisphaerota bacterium]MBT7847539.1 hypothetical protein [Lentisphaerota bacterium]